MPAMQWKKLGRIIEPRMDIPWMRTHAMVPTAEHVAGDIFRIYCSGRDIQNRSLVGYVDVNLGNPTTILKYSDHPALGLGELGCFDDNGVTPSWIIRRDGKKYLYYIGWKPRSTTRMSVVAGLAVSDDDGENFSRVSRAPILRQTDREPFSILTAPCVMHDNDIWKMWYVSGEKWHTPDLPRYNIKYAESVDGILWDQKGVVCIEAAAESETALARPCVRQENSIYKMWYSTKPDGEWYRIGYAESADGIEWTRMDEKAGIDVSDSGWDSEMVEYPFVFDHRGGKYMLYNGNGYGTTGIGLAVLK